MQSVQAGTQFQANCSWMIVLSFEYVASSLVNLVEWILFFIKYTMSCTKYTMYNINHIERERDAKSELVIQT